MAVPAGGVEAAPCVHCGMPLDARPFDASSVQPAPAEGQALVLARFELPPQYCGLLEYFAQFTDQHGASPANVLTHGVRWTLRVNQRPLEPYRDLDHVVNPWGFGCYPVRLRLDDAATLELVVRGVPVDPGLAPAPPKVKLVGGRIVGRFWYDAEFGDVVRARR